MLLNYINGNFAIFLGAIYYGLIATEAKVTHTIFYSATQIT